MIKMKVLEKILPLALIFTLAIATMSLAYIGNARSHIFHADDCYYVTRMNENNKVYFEDRQDAIDSGYRPCKVCHP
jgi:hypothetical protein